MISVCDSICRFAAQIASRSITGSACSISADAGVGRCRDRGRPRAHQRQRPQRGGVGERGRPGHQPAERVADQVGRPVQPGQHRQDVVGQHLHVVRRGVVGPRRLVLPALVDRQHLVAGRGERRQDRDEVLLGAGVPGHQQHRAHRSRRPARHAARPAVHAAWSSVVARTPAGSSRKGGVLTSRNATGRPVTRRGEGQAQWRAVSRTIAVANQKGGVAKTTTVASLGSALAERATRCCWSTSTRSPA